MAGAAGLGAIGRGGSSVPSAFAFLFLCGGKTKGQELPPETSLRSAPLRSSQQRVPTSPKQQAFPPPDEHSDTKGLWGLKSFKFKLGAQAAAGVLLYLGEPLQLRRFKL